MYTGPRFAVNGDLGDSVKSRGAKTRSRQADYGMPAGDQSGHDCGVHPRTGTDLRGRKFRCLVDLLKQHVSRLVVCDPRKAALLKEGNKSDRNDA